MRDKLKIFGVLLLAGIVSILVCSCKNGSLNNPFEQSEDSYCVSDSTLVAHVIEDWVDPSINSAEEAVVLQEILVEEDSINNVFKTMPSDVVKNVAAVLLKRFGGGPLKRKDIVLEFQQHKDIYINLPATPNPKPVDKTATDLGNRSENDVISTSYRYRTDTINGKPTRVKIKTEESYE